MSADLKAKVSLAFNHEGDDLLSACGISIDEKNVDKKINKIVEKYIETGKDPERVSTMIEDVINSVDTLEELLAVALPSLADNMLEVIRFGIDIKFIDGNLHKIPNEDVRKAYEMGKIPKELIPTIAEQLRSEMGLSGSPCECEKCTENREKLAKSESSSKVIPMGKTGLA